MQTGEEEAFAADLMTASEMPPHANKRNRAARHARRGLDGMTRFSPGMFFIVFASGTAAFSTILCLAFSLVAYGAIRAPFVLGWLAIAVVTSACVALAAARIHARTWERQMSLEHFATVDELTGAPNRRVFVARLASEVDRCSRQGSALCLVFIDIDHFKRINDDHGHQVGDHVLREIYARLEDNLRLYDFVGRLGGDEFVMALPGTDALTAHGVAERIRESVELTPITDLPPVTVSLGVAELGPAMTAENLVRNADMALYRAKNSGRNRTEIFRSSGHSVS